MRYAVLSSKAAMSLGLVSLLTFSPLSVLAATKPQYLPPIAPQMDRSIFTPQTPPEVAHSNYDDSQAPVQASSNDQAQGLLRDALQKHNQGDLSGARNLFKRVLSIDPRNADANFNLGAMAEDAGDLQSAQSYYKAASLASPNDADVRDALAAVNSKLQQQSQQRETAVQMQKKNNLRQVAQDAATAYKAGQYEKAISLLERIDREAPGDANVKYGLGQAYRGKGDMSRARQNLQAAASIDPGNQLYSSTLAELNRQAQQAPQVADQRQGGNPGGMQYDDMPPGARDYGSNQNIPPIAANDGSPAGQITPFTSEGAPSASLFGRANGYGNGGIALGGGLGSLGMGALGGLGSMFMSGGSYGQPYYGGSRGTRLVRGAVTGSLAGAAVGALTNMGRGGGMKSGAMKGAVMGGLFGLLSSF